MKRNWYEESDAAMRRKLAPAGCDQQGRQTTRQPPPAEACTEIGADTEDPPGSLLLGLVITLAPWVLIAWALYAVLHHH